MRNIHPERALPLRNWPVYRQAFLLEQALRQHALLVIQSERLQPEPHLAPVVRVLYTSWVRLPADCVRLGKTIQVGWVLTELIARRLAYRILIVAPAGILILLEQWHAELVKGSGLQMHLFDRATLEQIRREAELGVNPFDHLPLGLASIGFLKRSACWDS